MGSRAKPKRSDRLDGDIHARKPGDSKLYPRPVFPRQRPPSVSRSAYRLIRCDRTTNVLAVVGYYTQLADCIADLTWLTGTDTHGLYLLADSTPHQEDFPC